MGNIKIGGSDITLKVGSSAVTAAYLGDTLLYPTTPTFSGKWIATYTGGTTSSAECDASSAITNGEITTNDIISVEIGDCVTSIVDAAFVNCTGLTSCTIGSGVTNIGSSTFYGCSNLTTTNIPDGVTNIGIGVFYKCRSLTSITIPNSVTSIGDNAFNGCSGLTSIDIPDSVTSIGLQAFTRCSGLTSITFEATIPPTLGAAAFYGSTCLIYVPSASVSTYQSASGWSDYASRIQAIPNS